MCHYYKVISQGVVRECLQASVRRMVRLGASGSLQMLQSQCRNWGLRRGTSVRLARSGRRGREMGVSQLRLPALLRAGQVITSCVEKRPLRIATSSDTFAGDTGLL